MNENMSNQGLNKYWFNDLVLVNELIDYHPIAKSQWGENSEGTRSVKDGNIWEYLPIASQRGENVRLTNGTQKWMS